VIVIAEEMQCADTPMTCMQEGVGAFFGACWPSQASAVHNSQYRHSLFEGGRCSYLPCVQWVFTSVMPVLSSRYTYFVPRHGLDAVSLTIIGSKVHSLEGRSHGIV
jgi:hypothetical protein